ncbi:MAG: prepilin-type N-terminal cleavage/methylation domain-containing protein [bacterium]|nr:prepilin-type N-terminal cleavage/methylation domain-containing protein [bacterium]
MKRTKKRMSGFTVVEMLVTLAIMAMLLIVSVGVGRSAIQRASFTSLLNNFVADVAYARQLASRLNRYVAIDFDNTTGASYTIKVQDKLGDYTTFNDEKTVDPLDGETFFKDATDFSVNSMGMIRPYPVTASSSITTATVDFIQLNKVSGSTDYKKTVTLFPSGGVKIEK